MSQADQIVEPAFQGDSEDVIQYRSISKLAVVALFLGIASLAAFAHPVLWCIPIAAVVVAAFAVRVTSQPEYAGRAAAVCGLILAMLCGSAAISRQFVERIVVQKQARQITDRWAQMLADKQVTMAYEWTMGRQFRRPDDMSIMEYYGQNDEAAKNLATFKRRPEMQSLQKLGSDLSVEHLASGAYERSAFTHRNWNTYRFSNPAGEQLDLEIQATRTDDPSSKKLVKDASWYIRLFRDVNAEVN